jgi:hypothetical protein
MSLDTAKRQFDENKQLFGNPKSQPEKFNLYGGLSNLVEALQNIENDLYEVKRLIKER